MRRGAELRLQGVQNHLPDVSNRRDQIVMRAICQNLDGLGRRRTFTTTLNEPEHEAKSGTQRQSKCSKSTGRRNVPLMDKFMLYFDFRAPALGTTFPSKFIL